MYHNLKLILTKDGSHTIFIPGMNEHYHSVHGAVSESLHVYIHAGFCQHSAKSVNILEVGFGTGLNVLLTLKQAMEEKREVLYHAIDNFILPMDITARLNYESFPGVSMTGLLNMIHELEWGKEHQVSDFFKFKKILSDIKETEFTSLYDIIYFDAFGPDKQPEMWTEDIFIKLYGVMKPGGILTTYSSKGEVKRRLERCGFSIEKLHGPEGKREMMRCIRQ